MGRRRRRQGAARSLGGPMGGQTILSQDHVMFVITPNTSRGYWKDLFSPEKDDWKITGKSLIYD